MRDLISYATLGAWIGYLIRRRAPHIGEMTSGAKIGAAIGVAVLAISCFIGVGVSPATSGRWGYFVGIGNFILFDLAERRFLRLKRIRAGLWLLGTFLLVEAGRTYMIITN